MIKVGDKLPNATFTVMAADGPKPMNTDEIFAGRRIVLFAVPGPFTPTCDRNHLPSFRDKTAEIKAKGVDAIACTAINNVFVLSAWAKASEAADKIEFLADGNGDFAEAAGLSVTVGRIPRSKRYSMLVDNGVVKSINIEENPGIEKSGADNILTQL